MNARSDPPVTTGDDVERMLDALGNPACYPHPVRRIDRLETHISWVILTGSYAYKIKKPVNLGFLDFTSLAARRHYCEEELRLNRRLAPDIYLETVAITGAPQRPVIVDASFLRHAQRAAFRALAQELGVPFVIASVTVPHDVLRTRVAARAAQGGDASEATLAVLEAQLAARDALTADELGCAVTAELVCDAAASARALCAALAQRLQG